MQTALSAMVRRVAGGYAAITVPRWVPPVAVGLLWVVCQIVVFALVGQFAFPLDDGYIVLHNAQSLYTGDDNFAGAPPLSGSTSLLHTLGVALFLPVMPGPAALWLVSWFGIVAAGLGLDRLAHNLGCGPSLRIAVVAAALLAGQPLLVMLNGVETGWAVAAVAWALALSVAPRPGRGLAALCGLLPFVRPELGALGALLMLDLGWRRYKAAGSLRDSVRPIAGDFVVLAAVALPLLTVQWLGSGGPFPNTGAAKQYFFAGGQLPPGLKIAAGLLVLMLFGGALGPIFLASALVRSRIGLLGTGFAIIMLTTYAMVVPDVLAHNDFRYLYVLIPVMAANLAVAVTANSPAWRAFGFVFLALAVGWNLATLPAAARDYTVRAGGKLATMAGLADWIETNLDPDELVLIHDIGYVAHATSQPLVDLVGLKSPANIDIHRRHTDPTDPAGWGESTERIALRSGARVLVVSHGWEPVFGMAAGLKARGWTLTPLSDGIVPAGYGIYRIARPDQR